MTRPNLDDLFTYHAPTEATAPLYAAIRSAEGRANACIADAFVAVEYGDKTVCCEAINATTKAFAALCWNDLPLNPHNDAARMAIGLARNAANEAVFDEAGRGRLLAIAKSKLQEARWLACTAVACYQPE